MKINKIKKAKELLKDKFMVNGLKSMKKGLQKKNLNNALNYLKNLKLLIEIVDSLKVLSSNQGKFEISNEFILKGKNILNSFPENLKEKILILKIYEEELNKFSNKSSENMIEEFQKIISDFLLDSFEIKTLESIEHINQRKLLVL